jgi:hypothetical protein
MRSAVVYNLGDEGTAAAPLHSFHIAMKARKAADCYPKKWLGAGVSGFGIIYTELLLRRINGAFAHDFSI